MNRTRSTTRVQPVRRALAAAAVASLLGAGLAACGDKSGDGASAAPTSSGSSSAAGGPASTGTTPVAAPEAGQEVTSTAFVSTVKDGLAASTTAHMTMSMALGPMGRILIRGEPGHDIVPVLAPIAGEIVIDKPGKGAFYATALDALLAQRRIDTLLVGGVTTEVCVNTTVREANDRGYRCIVLADCCASYFPAFHEAGLQMIKAQGGIFGWVSDSDSVIAALGRHG